MRSELTFSTVLTAYGLTESTGTVTMCRQGDDPETIAATSGRAIPGLEVRVVDDEGTELARGEPGEIVVRGYTVVRGYFEDPEATAEAIDAEGWLHTGDIGVMDDAGNVRITDRKKDMFIVGGFNAYPAEIEGALAAPPRRGPGGGDRRARRAHGRGGLRLRGAPARHRRRPGWPRSSWRGRVTRWPITRCPATSR